MSIYGSLAPIHVAFGTYQSQGDDCYNSVRCAIDVGYRHIDTASYYANEELVGKAIRDSGTDRSDIYLTTKIWNSDQGTDLAQKSIEDSLKKLDCGYIDLMLIHWPIPVGHSHDYQELNRQTFEVMAKYKEMGLIRHIGVSNFLVSHLQEIEKNSGIRPELNQIEMHVGHTQDEIRAYCDQNNITVEAWRPLMRGTCDNVLVLDLLGKKYGKTPTQIGLRYLTQKGVVPIPKSVHEQRIRENFDIFDFTLSDADMEKIDANEPIRCGSHPLHLTRN